VRSTRSKRLRKIWSLGLICLLMSGCAGISVIDVSCLIPALGVIRPSQADTQGTKEQIADHNDARRVLCPKKP